MHCDHTFTSPTNTLVRSHPQSQPKFDSSDQEVYDEYVCEVCNNHTVHAYRELAYVPKYDGKGNRLLKVV